MVEDFGALGDAGFDHRPVAFGNQQRHMAQRPEPVDGLAIGAVGDALLPDVALYGLEAARNVVGAEPRHLVEKFQPMAARTPVGADELVGNAVERPIGRRHLDQPPRLGAGGVLRRGSQNGPLWLEFFREKPRGQSN